MKKEEIEYVLTKLNEIKTITDKQEYVVSKNVNLIMNEIKPILNSELQRLDFNKIECNTPSIKLIKRTADIEDLSEVMNKEMEQLVLNNFKIIDFNVINLLNDKAHEIIYTGIIKYTS